jgi:hypothetical protein
MLLEQTCSAFASSAVPASKQFHAMPLITRRKCCQANVCMYNAIIMHDRKSATGPTPVSERNTYAVDKLDLPKSLKKLSCHLPMLPCKTLLKLHAVLQQQVACNNTLRTAAKF